MKTRMMRKIAVLVTGSALALSFPVASSVANPGGVPNGGVGNPDHPNQGGGPNGGVGNPDHPNQGGGPNGGVGNSKPCPTKGKGTKKLITDLPIQAQDKGKKCGFKKGQNGNNLD